MQAFVGRRTTVQMEDEKYVLVDEYGPMYCGRENVVVPA